MKTVSIILITLLALATTAFAAPQQSFEAKVTGSGPTIIFIPGLASDGSVWDETIARYADTHQCHVLTLAGFGSSTLPPLKTDAFLKNVKTDLALYIAENHLDSPTIVGHSLGGFLALQLAIDHPQLASQLLIVDSLPFLPASMDPTATAESMQAQSAAQRDMMQQGGQNEAQLRMMMQMMTTAPANIDRALALALSMQSDPATVVQAMYELNTTDLRSQVSKIQTPTTILGAWVAYQQVGSTKESTAAIFDAQYAKLPNYQLHMSDHGKHFIMWDDPLFFQTHLDALLSKN
ncbi:hydrolase, alpha/beta fold family, putative [Verrucomicrobiia bacterium DG1235]|nr:hydrolase, alpha/beta fold family, putative [Verrucomicrobiae bacterium DG1235]